MQKTKQDELKQEAAKKAALMVEPNSVLGVGTGSTVAFFIDELAKINREKALNLKAIVTTSNRSRAQLEKQGFKVNELSEVDQIDLTVDGADRVDLNLNGIKGGGGALTLEKNVAVNSKKNIWIVDETKFVDRLKGFALPVEMLPISCEQNFRTFSQEGLLPKYRLDDNGKRYITHYGNFIIDLHVDPIPFPNVLAHYLDSVVGVVEHGLFLNICNEVIIAHSDGKIEIRKR
jgi:ribose 5-phosphate isomerase A